MVCVYPVESLKQVSQFLEECMESPLDVIHFRHQYVQSGILACHVTSVICVGLFDGLGGLRIALQKLGKYIVVILYISSEIDKPAKRLVRKRWPGVVVWGSVLSVSHDAVSKLGDMYSSFTDAVIIGAGSPCQDLSSLNAHRVGLSGTKSRLFYQVPRIIGLFQKAFGSKVHFFVENVFSMDKAQVLKFNSALATKPYMIDGGDFTYCHRKRLYWCNWKIAGSNSVSVIDKGHYFYVDVLVNKAPANSWISDDFVWEGPHLLPTLNRALPSEKPMKHL